MLRLLCSRMRNTDFWLFELMERGHDVTVLEGSRRTGGHVKTIRDPLPDGLYADVGAEHFTNPGYDDYRRYVEDMPEAQITRLRAHAASP